MMTAPSVPLATQRCSDHDPLGDDALRVAALKLLHSNGYTALRRLRCEVTEGVVVVHGVVPSYYLKQMVQTIVRRLKGIQGVMNLVEVREPDSC
jgi:osmotically-inducible protein OsmY